MFYKNYLTFDNTWLLITFACIIRKNHTFAAVLTLFPMAIVKFSGDAVVAKSGKQQGTVYLSNNVVRVWHKTKTVRDTATNLVKGLFSGISSAYKTLTPEQLLAWQNATVNYLRKNALAEVRTLTANQAFQRVNNLFASLGLLQQTSPPGVAVTDSITAVTLAADESAATFTADITTFGGATTLPANSFAKVYATPQYTPSKQKFSKSNYRFIGFYPPTTAINPLDIKAAYVAVFGDLIAGQRISVAIEYVFADDGSGVTPPRFKQNQRIYADTVVTA